MAAFALLPQSNLACFRPRLARGVPPAQPRQQQAACRSYRRRGDYGPGTSWGNILADLATSSVPEIMEMVQRDLERAEVEGRTGRSRYSSSSCGGPAPTGADVLLAVDTIETDDAIIFYADVPGLNKADLKIRVNQQDRLLTVSGERVKPEAGSESDSSTRLERTFGSFKRELTLPKSADLQAISAKVDKGVLRIRVLREIKRSASKEQEITID